MRDRDMTEIAGKRIARRLIADMRAGTAGATEWVTEEPKDGYLVGIPALHVRPNLDLETIESLTATWIDVALRHDVYGIVSVGVWLNPNGRYDLDFCDWHETESAALAACSARGELAAWDIANARELPNS